MNAGPQQRLPRFELSLVLVVVIILWAEVQLFNMGSDYRQSEHRLKEQAKDWQRRAQRLELQKGRMQDIFDDLISDLSEATNGLQNARSEPQQSSTADAPTIRQQQALVRSINKAHDRLRTNGLLHAPSQTDSAIMIPLETEAASLDYSAVIYLLVLAQISLGLFLAVAIYRRVVVERLRLKLYESAAENKLAHLEKLAAWQAHEIKQPLSAISAWLWTLQQSLPQHSPEHNVAIEIRKATDRLDQIVKDFLNLARPLEPQRVPLNATSVLREIQLLFQPRLQQQSITLQVESAAEESFQADPQQLKQVLINLVQNATESIQRNGSITLRARSDRLPLKGRLTRVILFEVSDNGPGIPPEAQPRLFDPFFSTKSDGTGLGLSIAARIVDKHGGTLEFQTRPGAETIFRVLLPISCDGG